MRARWLAAIIFASIALSTHAAHAATFDCKAAATVQEKLICATPILNYDDDQMGVAYKAWLAAAPDPIKPSLLADQRAWLSRRTKQCAGGDQKEMIDCLSYTYDDRIQQLNARVQTRDGISFVSNVKRLVIKDTADNAADATLEQVPGYGTLTATWPVAASDAPEWQKWNTAVELQTRRVAAPEGTKVFTTWSPAWAAGLDEEANANVISFEHGRVGVRVSDSDIPHASPHGYFEQLNFYWLLAEARPLKASDVFNPATQWSKPIVALCAAAILKQIGPTVKEFFGPANKNIAKVVADPANWTLLPEGLRITFPQYSVSDYADPANDITIPWSTLKPDLAPSFVPPQ